MRGMRYPLDIVFVDGTGTVTVVPEPGTAERDLTRYTDRARWVLEVSPSERRPTLHRTGHDGSEHWSSACFHSG